MKKYIIILVLIGITVSSCYKKLEMEPANAITTEQLEEVLKNATDAQWEGLVGIFPILICTNNKTDGSLEFRYNRLTGSNVMRGLMANDMVFANLGLVSGQATAFGGDEYQLSSVRAAGSNTAEGYWRIGWELINAANKALNIVTDDIVGDNNKLKKYQAWPLFVRAYGYNYLIENYSDPYALKGGQALGVPIYTVFDPLPENYKGRSTLEECYKQINDDLDKAIANFLADGSDGFQESKSALDIGAAYFLKARVALSMGRWDDAVTYCQKLLDKYGTTLMNETQYVAQRELKTYSVEVNRQDVTVTQPVYYAINSGFLNLAENPEVIYGFANAAAGAERQMNTQWMNIYGCNNIAGSKEGRNMCIDERLYTKIDDSDYRKKNFLNPSSPDVMANFLYLDGNRKNILPYATLKYAATVGYTGGTNLSDGKNNSLQAEYPMWRLSEVLLMKAEAEARGSGDWSSTLNILVEARTNGAHTVATYPAHSGLSPLQIVQLQSGIELWGENGTEFYNNRRWDIPVNRSGSANHWSAAIEYPVSGMTCQIPTLQMNLNGKLVQNP